jgi:NAD(P)-dependent dehydrogenase (short-subunit alcohol dehydrogenase family)
MTTTVITGANKGLGFEIARRLIAAGHSVCIGARGAERGRRSADEFGARDGARHVEDRPWSTAVDDGHLDGISEVRPGVSPVDAAVVL